jgi:hypothetical protein
MEFRAGRIGGALVSDGWQTGSESGASARNPSRSGASAAPTESPGERMKHPGTKSSRRQ